MLSVVTAQVPPQSSHLFLPVYQEDFYLKALICHSHACLLLVPNHLGSILGLIHTLKSRICVPQPLKMHSQRGGHLKGSFCIFLIEIHLTPTTERRRRGQYPAARCDPIADSEERKAQGHDQYDQTLDSDGLLPKAREVLIPDRQKLLLAVGVSYKLLEVEGERC